MCFPTTNAHGLSEHRSIVYQVRFETRELWGGARSANAVYLDCWEDYLELA